MGAESAKYPMRYIGLLLRRYFGAEGIGQILTTTNHYQEDRMRQFHGYESKRRPELRPNPYKSAPMPHDMSVGQGVRSWRCKSDGTPLGLHVVDPAGAPCMYLHGAICQSANCNTCVCQ